MFLTHPRYEPRELPLDLRRNRLACGVFDTFAQEFVSGPNSRAQAERDARAANRAYEDGRNLFVEAMKCK